MRADPKIKRRKDVKLNTWTISLTCLAVFALFAVSTKAQNGSIQLPSKAYAAKAATVDKSPDAEAQGRGDGVSSDVTENCTYTFTSGSGTTFLKFCVTVNGNITQFQSPAGVEQISQGGSGLEGYGVCDATNDNTQYYDYADMDSGNWNAPTTVTHTASEVKIERTTTDGAWTLTQTITPVAGTNPYAKVVMSLKNNSATTKIAALLRYAEPVPDNAGSTNHFQEYYDGTQDSAWGYTPVGSTNGAGHYGLMIQNVGNPAPTAALVGREGFARVSAFGPPPCNASKDMESPVLNDVGSVAYYYVLSLEKEQTFTVTDRYISF
jgi:hypothetical protein